MQDWRGDALFLNELLQLANRTEKQREIDADEQTKEIEMCKKSKVLKVVIQRMPVLGLVMGGSTSDFARQQ